MSGAPVSSAILSFEEARSIVEAHAENIQPTGVETIDLLDAAGRILAEPVLADRDIPPFARATRDGYAVHSSDLAAIPTSLDVIGEIKAGEKPDKLPHKLLPGQAVAIMTGAPVPPGADAVIMVEHTKKSGNQMEAVKSVEVGENIVPCGAEAGEGSLLVKGGTRLNEASVALAASVGKSRLSVQLRPSVAVLTTGDEIVPIDKIPGPTQIRNSNSYSLAVQIQKAGGRSILLPIAPDEPAPLRALIEEGLHHDLLLMTGGVSMGRYDLVEQVLSEMQVEFFFTGAKIQPGKPVVFGRRNGGVQGVAPRYFFGLPGNPVSTMVTFELFARPVLEAFAGMRPVNLNFVQARLRSEIRVKPGLRRFLPANLSGSFENTEVELVPWQGSGDVVSAAQANCYIVISPDREQLSSGEFVPILMR